MDVKVVSAQLRSAAAAIEDADSTTAFQLIEAALHTLVKHAYGNDVAPGEPLLFATAAVAPRRA